MRNKIPVLLIILTGISVMIAGYFRSQEIHAREPIVITGYASYEEVSLDGLILEADIIVVGEVNSTAPSRWNTVDGKLPNTITLENINSKYTIFTDQLFVPRVLIKGREKDVIRIRYFSGQVDQDIMTISGEVVLDANQSYLLFLIEDTLGTTAKIDPGHYIVLGSIQGVYKINGDKAISFRDEWLLEDLIAYIKKSLSGEATLPTEPALPPTESSTPAPP